MKLEARELRIGNYVIDNRDDSIHRITAGTIHSFEFSNKDILSPIPLTEEWLLRFGFKQRESKDWFYNDKFVIEKYFGKDRFCIRFRVFENESIEIAKVDFVHQLQNITHSLTGTELILK